MFKNLQIKTLIVGVLVFFIAMLLLLGGLGLYSVKNTTALLQNTSMKDIRVNASVDKIRFKMEVNRSQILQALQHNPATEWAKLHDHPLAVHFKLIGETSAEIKQLWTAYSAGIESADERKLAQDWFDKSGALGVTAVDAAGAAIQQDKWDEAEGVLIRNVNPGYRVSDVALRALGDFLLQRDTANGAAVSAKIAATGYLMAGAIALAALLSVVAGVLLVRGITAPLAQAIGIARRVARGDLGSQIEVHSRNEIGQLVQALGEMDGSLAHIVRDVRAATDTIDAAASQIASGNQELSSRTEQQAGSLEETASSMEELTSTVRQNGDNARQANQLALSAAEVAGKGGAVVSQVVVTMGSINESAKKIVDIIGVIDGIAFQTNILALNAAVEAARAGEQGRGFAVVASEVRNLAQRSAGAAKEIKALIGDSMEKVTLGARLVDQAGSTMQEIVSSVNRVTDIMTEITAASQEQSNGIDHINKAINQMDAATQQNAKLVEDAAAAAGSLEQQAKSLVQLVSVFKVENGARAAPRPLPSGVRDAATAPPKLRSLALQK